MCAVETHFIASYYSNQRDASGRHIRARVVRGGKRKDESGRMKGRIGDGMTCNEF